MITGVKGGTVLLRPDNGFGFIEIDAEVVRGAWKELKTRAALISVGLDRVTATDKFVGTLMLRCGVTDDALAQAEAWAKTNG